MPANFTPGEHIRQTDCFSEDKVELKLFAELSPVNKDTVTPMKFFSFLLPRLLQSTMEMWAVLPAMMTSSMESLIRMMPWGYIEVVSSKKEITK